LSATACETGIIVIWPQPHVADVMAKNIEDQFTSSDDGFYDQKGAINTVEAMQLNSGIKQAMRQKLVVPSPDRLSDPNILATAPFDGRAPNEQGCDSR